MRDALSGIFDIGDASGTVILDSPAWFPGWHVTLLKLAKSAIHANRDDTHDLLIQFQERMMDGPSGPAAFKALFTELAHYFDPTPHGDALETLQTFGVIIGTPFSSYLRAFRVVVASIKEKGAHLVPSAEMVMELDRIRTTHQYPMLLPL